MDFALDLGYLAVFLLEKYFLVQDLKPFLVKKAFILDFFALKVGLRFLIEGFFNFPLTRASAFVPPTLLAIAPTAPAVTALFKLFSLT